MIKVAEPTIERLVQYHRLLESLQDEGQRVISSQQMGDLLGIKASQVRKDLSYFGEIGKRGVGYHVGRLYEHVFRILASPKTWKVALAGAGNLGLALIGHSAFKNQNFCVEALFDVDPQKVNREIAGVHCWHFDDMTAVLDDLLSEALRMAEDSSENLNADMLKMLHLLTEGERDPEKLQKHDALLPVCQRVADLMKYRVLFMDGNLSDYIVKKMFQAEKEKMIPLLQEYCNLPLKEAEMLFLFVVYGSFTVNNRMGWTKDQKWYEVQGTLIRFILGGIDALQRETK